MCLPLPKGLERLRRRSNLLAPLSGAFWLQVTNILFKLTSTAITKGMNTFLALKKSEVDLFPM